MCEKVGRTRAWNCLSHECRHHVAQMGDGGLLTDSGKPVSQHEDAVGLAETMLLEFTLSFSGNSCPGSHHCGQQTTVTVPGPGFSRTHGYLNKSSQLFLLSLPTSYMGYSGCKINCMRSIFMLTSKSLAQWEALRMTGTCLKQIPASKYNIFLWENCSSSLSSEFHLRFLISWEIKD